MRDLTRELPRFIFFVISQGRLGVLALRFDPNSLFRRKITGSHFERGRPIVKKGSWFLQNETIGRSEDRTHFPLVIRYPIRYFSQKSQGSATTSQDTSVHRMLPEF